MIKRIGLPLAILLASLWILPAVARAQPPAESTCIQCHGGQEGRLGRPVEEWRGSIHASNGIACNNCHGGNPTLMSMEAMSPDQGFAGAPTEEEIPGFCGKCHVGVEKDYLSSAHGQALGLGGPQCVTCHGNHAVRKASPDLINPEDCSRCHEYGRAELIKKAVVKTDALIGDLSKELTALHRVGITTKEMEGEVFSLRNRFHRLFHSVDVDKVRQQTEEFQKEIQGIREKVEVIQAQLDRRKLAGGVVVGLLALAGVLALLIRRTYHEEEEG